MFNLNWKIIFFWNYLIFNQIKFVFGINKYARIVIVYHDFSKNYISSFHKLWWITVILTY